MGSQPGDLPSDTTLTHPFEPCPATPNCLIYSTMFEAAPENLYMTALNAVNNLSPYSVEPNSQSLQIKSVFRIAFFGYKDDVSVVIKPGKSGRSEFHIKSTSRVGHSDLGVNRRRVKRILKQINQNL
ncbi:MAG: DUF1499 domain-containing protein [Balneolaceae bacterium]|nr:MAG: DUF1499 domain-containing protein [Balneolaceae bacterium]